MSKDIDDEVRCMRMANGEHGLIAKTDGVVEMSDEFGGYGDAVSDTRCDGRCDNDDCWCGVHANQPSLCEGPSMVVIKANYHHLRMQSDVLQDMRSRLEKVRDELYQARDWYKSNSPPGQGLCHIGVTNALRMLEAILEGRGE